jgi:hypothetical protein
MKETHEQHKTKIDIDELITRTIKTSPFIASYNFLAMKGMRVVLMHV